VKYVKSRLSLSRTTHWISFTMLPTRIWWVEARWGRLTRISRFTSVVATWVKYTWIV
jgi:hypothetical protein